MIITLFIVTGIVMCVFCHCFFRYKSEKLEYKKVENEYAEKTIKERTQLDIEKERTEQRRLEYQKEAENTKQLEIKSSYKKETGANLY